MQLPEVGNRLYPRGPEPARVSSVFSLYGGRRMYPDWFLRLLVYLAAGNATGLADRKVWRHVQRSYNRSVVSLLFSYTGHLELHRIARISRRGRRTIHVEDIGIVQWKRGRNTLGPFLHLWINGNHIIACEYSHLAGEVFAEWHTNTRDGFLLGSLSI